MDRALYEEKINEYFKTAGLKYKYRKNDEKIYDLLTKYGSLSGSYICLSYSFKTY